MTDQDIQQLNTQVQDMKQRFESHAHTQYDGTKRVRTSDLESSTVAATGTSRVRGYISSDYYPGVGDPQMGWTTDYDGLGECDTQSFTAKNNGYYLFHLQGSVNVPAGASGQFYSKKNNSIYLISELSNATASSICIPMSLHDVLSLAKGDVVNFWMHSTSASLFLKGLTANLTIHRLS